MRSCIMPGLPTHLVQELNVGIVSQHDGFSIALSLLGRVWIANDVQRNTFSPVLEHLLVSAMLNGTLDEVQASMGLTILFLELDIGSIR